MGAIGKCQLDTLDEDEEQNEIQTANETDGEILLSQAVVKKPAYLKHKDCVDLIQAQKDIENAKEEWELVSSTVPPPKPVVHDTALVTCEEVLTYFRGKDMSSFHGNIKPVKQKTGIGRLFHCIFGPPKLNSTLTADRDFVFSIAQCPFDSTDSIHIRVLQTIYKKMTATTNDCPRYGSHWEDIGFQGADPGTDLRGVGFLGLYHLLYLLQDPLVPNLWQEISSLSHSETQEFPFCLMGINITRIVLETLRAEALNKECNKVNNVFLVTSKFYVGLYFQFYKIWKTERKSIMDSGYVLKDLGILAKKKPNFIFQQLRDYTEGKTKLVGSPENDCSFSDIGGISFQPSTEVS